MCGYSHFSFWIPITLDKICSFPMQKYITIGRHRPQTELSHRTRTVKAGERTFSFQSRLLQFLILWGKFHRSHLKTTTAKTEMVQLIHLKSFRKSQEGNLQMYSFSFYSRSFQLKWPKNSCSIIFAKSCSLRFVFVCFDGRNRYHGQRCVSLILCKHLFGEATWKSISWPYWIYWKRELSSRSAELSAKVNAVQRFQVFGKSAWRKRAILHCK